jgi:2-keto-4-pentenoate hydratase/2-oxohepta-3-ene-1,7-dioic acid hydratase in catechol pathway
MLRAMLALRVPAASRLVRPSPVSRRRCFPAARASSTAPGVSVDVGPPPHVALVTFARTPGAKPELGLVENGHWLWTLDPDGKKYPRGMLDVIEQWHDGSRTGGRSNEDMLEERKGDPVPLESVTLLAPIPDPPSIVCVGKNYLEHIGEVDSSIPGISSIGAAPPEYPIIFTKAPTSVIGHGESIKIPSSVSVSIDYEGELGIVIGARVPPGSVVDAETAWACVFGFTVVNDVTARDTQKKHQQWYLGKSFDTFCPMGPWLVPKRTFVGSFASSADGHTGGVDGGRLQALLRTDGVRMGTAVNGEIRQSSSTSAMLFDVPNLLAVVNRAMTLRPGDVIATGTPAGVGAGMDPKGFLKNGDTCVVSVEGIGRLRNPVVDAE